MNTTEKKLNAVIACLMAESMADQERARRVLRELMTAPPAQMDAESETRRVLLELGVPEHIKGHPRLVCAVCAVVEKPDFLNAITKELYTMIAETFHDKPSRVERSIRHAIECAWDRCDLDVRMHYFGNTISPVKCKPTNSEFIARVANEIRHRLAE